MRQNTESLDVTWDKPTFLLPLYCLCVLLASTESLTVAIATSVIMMVTITLSGLLLLLIGRLIAGFSGTILWLVLTGAMTALLELVLHAWHYELYKRLGMFLPMIAIGSLLLARQELRTQFARPALAGGRVLLMSVGYTLAAVVLGAGRELVGRGSLFNEAGKVWGAWATPLEMHFFRADMGFLLAALAPGAFIALGLGVALYNWLRLQTPRQ